MNLKASAIGFLRNLRDTEYVERKILRLLMLLLGYSTFVGVISFNVRPPLIERAMTDRHRLNGMLVRTDNGFHFYDFANLHSDVTTDDLDMNPVDAAKAIPIAFNEIRQSGSTVVSASDAERNTRVLGNHMLLTRGASGATLYDSREKRRYELLDERNDMVVLNDKNDIVFTAPRESGYVFQYFFPACLEPFTVRLPEDGRDMPALLSTLGLPLQKKLLFSPYEQNVAVLDHSYQSRIALVNAINKETTVLKVPEMSDAQIQFSPFFVNDDLLLFSAVDGDKAATYSYAVSQRRYDVFSPNFTDEAYLSRTGKIVLLQSFGLRAGNVPFGSVASIIRKAEVRREEAAGIWGMQDDGWRDLFENPDEDILRFKGDARERLDAVDNPVIREAMISFWNSLFDPESDQEGETRIMRYEGNQLVPFATRAYTVNARRPYFLWREDIESLLQALDIPSDVIAEYRNQATVAANAGKPYEVMDIH